MQSDSYKVGNELNGSSVESGAAAEGRFQIKQPKNGIACSPFESLRHTES